MNKYISPEDFSERDFGVDVTARRRSQRGRFREEVGYKDASTTLKISLLSFLRYYLYSFGVGLIIRSGLERFINSGRLSQIYKSRHTVERTTLVNEKVSHSFQPYIIFLIVSSYIYITS